MALARRALSLLPPAARWARMRGPAFVTWALTERCNYRCDHCGFWRVSEAELSADDAQQYARDIVRAGVVAVNLCGGEVLLRPDLGALIRTLTDGGIVVRVTTNGALVHEQLDALRPVSCLKLSLDGPPALHDAVRGDGAFAAVERALALARQAGIPTMLNTVLSAGVCADIDGLLDTVGALGSPATFNPLEVRHAIAARGVDRAAPEPAAVRGAVGRLVALKQRGDARIGNAEGTLRWMASWPELPPVDCRAGKWFCRVLSDGRVVACDRPYAPHPPPPPGQRPAGFLDGIAQLERAGACSGCWRNNTAELNRALSGSLSSLGSMVGWF